jgi:allophanate hydrolase subunit 1
MIMMRRKDHFDFRERLIGEIAELCPGLSETTAWANNGSRFSALKLARKLDRLAACHDRSELRAIADCIRLVSLPVRYDSRLLAEHKRVAKSLRDA